VISDAPLPAVLLLPMANTRKVSVGLTTILDPASLSNISLTGHDVSEASISLATNIMMMVDSIRSGIIEASMC
jgi:hypothetical protein